MLAKARLGEVVEWLVARFAPAAIILFGSAARDRATSDSDLDLAILPAAPLDPVALADAGAELQATFGIPVDLVDLSKATPVLGAQVLKYGKVVSVTATTQLGAFIARTLADYEDLKAVRAPIEARMIGGGRGR
jgi:predicted nucleotidyltransferase